MMHWQNFVELLRQEWRQLTTMNASKRGWPMPFAAALACGLPLLIGAYFDHLDYGLISSLGGLVFLYLPDTPMYHRMSLLMACAFGMGACFTLGIMSHFLPALMVLVLTFIAILATMACRFYGLGPPGSLFFVMAASIGAYSPAEALQIPLHVGLLAMGCLVACLIALFYSLYVLWLKPPQPIPTLPLATFDSVVFDSVIIGSFVGIALMLAHLLHMERAYWVPISCLAVIQEVSLRGVWNKQIHRIIGTGIGLLLAWGLLALPLDKWSVCLLMITLTFTIESLVVRHYGLAVMFITPLTIFLAEGGRLNQSLPADLIQARFFDTALGCIIGLIGGTCLHHPKFREVVGRQLRRLIPSRFIQ